MAVVFLITVTSIFLVPAHCASAAEPHPHHEWQRFVLTASGRLDPKAVSVSDAAGNTGNSHRADRSGEAEDKVMRGSATADFLSDGSVAITEAGSTGSKSRLQRAKVSSGKPKTETSTKNSDAPAGDMNDALPSSAPEPTLDKSGVTQTQQAQQVNAAGATKVQQAQQAQEDSPFTNAETEELILKSAMSNVFAELRQAVNGSTPTANILIGTPPVSLKVIFDTGSADLVAKTWLTVTNMLQKVDTGLDGRIAPLAGRFYTNSKSTTFTQSYQVKDGKRRPKTGYVEYGSGPAVTQEGQDNVVVGGQNLSSMPFMEIAQDSLTMLHTSTGIAGILGLQHMKDRSLGKSVFSRLRDIGRMDAFGYCRGNGDNGTFIWGDTSTDGQSVEVIGDMHWAVNMTDFRATGGSHPRHRPERPGEMIVLAQTGGVGDDDPQKVMRKSHGRAVTTHASSLADNVSVSAEESSATPTAASKQTEANSTALKMCEGAGCAAIIDTGSNIIAGPREAIMDLARKLNVAKDCSNLHELATLEFSLGGVPFKVPPSAYVMKLKVPKSMRSHRDDDMEEEGAGGDSLEESSEDEDEQATDEMEDVRMFMSFAKMSRTYGVSILDVFDAVEDDEDATDATLSESSHVCMPAIVPLDKETRFGALWVIGSPLFENYYTRWSFPKGDEAPKIFFEDLKTASACREQVPSAPSLVASPPAVDQGSSGSVMRRARRGHERKANERKFEKVRDSKDDMQTLSFHKDEVPKHPHERSASEIMYPHWATNLLTL